MPQRESEKRRKPHPVRLSDDEHAAILAKAGACNMEFSAFMRMAGLNKQIPTRSRQAQINELRRLGGLLKHLYLQGAADLAQMNPHAFQLVLAELRMAVRRTEQARE